MSGAPLRLAPTIENIRLLIDAHQQANSFEIHGDKHWRGVVHIGLNLARLDPRVDPLMVFLFGLFHDLQRANEGNDFDHGRRAGSYVLREGSSFSFIPPDKIDILAEACSGHVDGDLSSHPSIGACWDADRLSLWRLSIEPKPEFLSRDISRDPQVIREAAGWTKSPPSWEVLLQELGNQS